MDCNAVLFAFSGKACILGSKRYRRVPIFLLEVEGASEKSHVAELKQSVMMARSSHCYFKSLKEEHGLRANETAFDHILERILTTF